MMPNEELVIRITPEKQRICLQSACEGVTSCKEIDADTFLECIKNSVQRDKVESGFLPEHCFHVGMMPDGSRDYCLWYPELYTDISYYGTEYHDFPLPRLVFGIRVNKDGKVLGCRLGVVEDGTLKERSPMYAYPFSNVAGFSLCTGNNPLPNYKNLHTLATLPGFLLRLPNNNDRFNAQNNKLHMQYRELLEHLKDKEPTYYYTDVLVPNGKTIKNFMMGGY